MANTKKPDKNGSRKDVVKCDRTYVADRCSRTPAQAQAQSTSSASSSSVSVPASTSSSSSPPNSPAMMHAQDTPCKHHRRGAVRAKRSVSLNKPRPMDQRSGNAYVEAGFADGKQPSSDEQQQSKPTGHVSMERRWERWTSNLRPEDRVPTERKTNENGDVNAKLPQIDFSSIGEDIMMKPLQPAPELTDGIEEFPAYVPWKATAFPAGTTGVMVTRRSPMVSQAAAESVMCAVCKKCMCVACQRKCKFPRVRACSADVPYNRFTNVAAACLPCVNKTARCVEYRPVSDDDASIMSDCSGCCCSRRRPAVAAAVGNRRHARPSAVSRLGMLLLGLFCPCVFAYRQPPKGRAKCSDTCYGNEDVSGCKCVDWDALISLNRDRRRRHYCQRRHLHRASDTTITTNNSTAAADSSSNTAPSSSSTATAVVATTDNSKDASIQTTTAAVAKVTSIAHDDVIRVYTDTPAVREVKTKLRPYRTYRHPTE